MKVLKFVIALSLMLSVSVTAFADMNISVDSGIVTISGTVPDAKGNYVNIIVQDKNGNLIYVGQEDIDSNGDFTVQYEPQLSEYGEHRVTVVSDNSGDKTMVQGYSFTEDSDDDSSQSTKPTVKPSGGSSGGGGGGGGGLTVSTSTTTTIPTTAAGTSNLVVAQLLTDVAPFLDISEHWAKKEIEKAYAEGWVNGIDETTFAPDNMISRAEMATLLVKKFNIKAASAENVFSDISASDWYEPYISVLCAKGIVDGYGDVFLPNKPVTRQEAAKMIMLAYGAELMDENEIENRFSDDDSISDWAKQYIYTANKLGIIQGKDGNIFDPNGNATRAEVVVMLSRTE